MPFFKRPTSTKSQTGKDLAELFRDDKPEHKLEALRIATQAERVSAWHKLLLAVLALLLTVTVGPSVPPAIMAALRVLKILS